MIFKNIYRRAKMGITRKQDKFNKQRIQSIFKHFIKDASSYTIICCQAKHVTHATFIKPLRYDHYIVGFSQDGERILVVIPIQADLKVIQEPIIFKKANGSEINFSKYGYCNAQDARCSITLEAITYLNQSNKNSIAILQSEKQVEELYAFFKKGL